MEWQDICQNSILQNLPFKIQTDKWGNIVMRPASNEHGMYQARLVQLLSRFNTDGLIITECSIQTTEGVKVADVAYASAAFVHRHKTGTPYCAAPEVCIEVLSPSNTMQEMNEKRALYFSAGAQEVWLCQNGALTFYTPLGEQTHSLLFAACPQRIELYLLS